jgi:hypothetical protein
LATSGVLTGWDASGHIACAAFPALYFRLSHLTLFLLSFSQ